MNTFSAHKWVAFYIIFKHWYNHIVLNKFLITKIIYILWELKHMPFYFPWYFLAMVLSHWTWSLSWSWKVKGQTPPVILPLTVKHWLTAILFFGASFHLYLILPNPFPHNLFPYWRISELEKQSWLLMDCSRFLLTGDPHPCRVLPRHLLHHTNDPELFLLRTLYVLRGTGHAFGTRIYSCLHYQ